MTFMQAITKWSTMIFGFVTDFYELIMSYRFTAFAFWACVFCGGLYMLGNLVVSSYQLADETVSINRGFDRMFSRERRRQERNRRATERQQLMQERQARLEEQRARRDMFDRRRFEADIRRMRKEAEIQAETQKKRNREEYAQMLLNTHDYKDSRYVTIEGKRYYRKGLVSFGEKMKSSDRDYSYDLEDIDKTKKGVNT